MTNPTPIPITPPPGKRLSVLPGRRDCAPHDIKVLLGLHQRLERVLRPYAQVTNAIVRKLEGAL